VQILHSLLAALREMSKGDKAKTKRGSAAPSALFCGSTDNVENMEILHFNENHENHYFSTVRAIW